MRRVDPAHVVVLAAIVAALHVGKLPTAIPVLREQLGMSLVQAGFLLALVQLAGMLFGLVVGLAADSIGLKRTMASGLCLVATASALGAWSQDVAALMLLRALEGFGFLLATMPGPSLIRRLVDAARVNPALGLWGAYMPVGTATALILGPLAIAAFGWRVWWTVLGFVALAMAVVLVAALEPDPLRARENGTRESWSDRLALTLRAPGPWLVSAAFAAYSSQWLSLVGFLPTVYAQAGIGPQLAGGATALVALVNMVGNVSSGRMLHRGWQPQHLLFIGFAAMAAGGVIAFAPLPEPLRYAAAVGFSMFGGLVPGTLFSLAVRLAPSAGTVSTTVGWMQQWSSLGQFAGPPLVALVAARVGGWEWSGAVTGTFATLGFVVAAVTGRLIRKVPT